MTDEKFMNIMGASMGFLMIITWIYISETWSLTWWVSSIALWLAIWSLLPSWVRIFSKKQWSRKA